MQTGLQSQGKFYLQQNLALTTRKHLNLLFLLLSSIGCYENYYFYTCNVLWCDQCPFILLCYPI